MKKSKLIEADTEIKKKNHDTRCFQRLSNFSKLDVVEWVLFKITKNWEQNLLLMHPKGNPFNLQSDFKVHNSKSCQVN